jgi:D-alanine-D-alanine ligase
VDKSITTDIRKLSIQAYQALRCDDFARVDLFLTDDGKIIINEINTIPGFTSSSMFPMMWEQMGMSYTQLISELIHLSLKRFNSQKDLETDYNSAN